MKKMFIVAALVIGFAGFASAQVDGKAIGVRFGGLSGYGGEISYQHPLGSSNRLEADLGWNYYGIGLAAVYQWVWDLSALADGFNWYAGVGGGLGLYDYAYLGGTRNSAFNLGVAGQVGIEYNFNIPIQVSLDYRPVFYLLNSGHFSSDAVALSVRYKF